MNTDITSPKERLAADLKAVVADAEELLRATAGQAGEKLQSVRARAEETLKVVKNRIDNIEDAAIDKAKAAARATDEFAHEKPWQAIAIASGVSLLIGWLAGRNTR